MKMEKLIRINKDYAESGFMSGRITDGRVYVGAVCVGSLCKNTKLPKASNEVTVLAYTDNKTGKRIIKCDNIERPEPEEYKLICGLCNKYHLAKPVYDARAYAVFKDRLNRYLMMHGCQVQA